MVFGESLSGPSLKALRLLRWRVLVCLRRRKWEATPLGQEAHSEKALGLPSLDAERSLHAMEPISFAAAQADTAGVRRHLLLGNGFSSGRFAEFGYQKLFEFTVRQDPSFAFSSRTGRTPTSRTRSEQLLTSKQLIG